MFKFRILKFVCLEFKYKQFFKPSKLQYLTSNNKHPMLQSIKTTFANNKYGILYSLFGASVFSTYFLYLRKEIAKRHELEIFTKRNKLDTTFEELLEANKNTEVLKIVFTEADKSSGNYRKHVIDKIKDVFPQKDIGVLINCTPKKVFETGCESFIQTFEQTDPQYADYIVNLLKQELLIEDTFQKIEKVSQPNGRTAIMVCDNNCLDIMRIQTAKGEYLDPRLYELALQKLNIKIKDLYDIYSVVIHFEEDASTETQEEVKQNAQIEKIWGNKNFRGFYQKFKYDNSKSKEENVNAVIRFLHERIRDEQKKKADNKKELQEK